MKTEKRRWKLRERNLVQWSEEEREKEKKRRMYEYDLFVLAKIYLYNVLKNKSSMDDSV